MHTLLLSCVGLLQARRHKTIHTSVSVVIQSPSLLVPSLWVPAATNTKKNFTTVVSVSGRKRETPRSLLDPGGDLVNIREGDSLVGLLVGHRVIRATVEHTGEHTK